MRNAGDGGLVQPCLAQQAIERGRRACVPADLHQPLHVRHERARHASWADGRRSGAAGSVVLTQQRCLHRVVAFHAGRASGRVCATAQTAPRGDGGG
eukprot:7378222-Prymnesium_polylepis.1